MNTFVIAPDVQPEFGDGVIETTRALAVLPNVDSVARLSGMARGFVRIAVQCQRLESTSRFDGSDFLEAVTGQEEIQQMLGAVFGQAIVAAKAAQSALTSGISVFSTLGNAQLQFIMELCELSMQAGCLLRRICLRIGSRRDPDWEQCRQQTKDLKQKIVKARSLLQGAMQATPPTQEPADISALRAWMGVVGSAIAVFVSVGTQPQVLLSFFKDLEVEGDRLVNISRKVLELSMNASSSFKTEGATETQLAMVLGPNALDKEEYPWDTKMKFHEKMRASLRKQAYLSANKSENATNQEKTALLDPAAEVPDTMSGLYADVNSMSPERQKRWWWMMRKSIDGGGPTNPPGQNAMFPEFTAPQELVDLLALDSIINDNLRKHTSALREAARRDLSKVDEFNIPEDRRTELREEVLRTFATAEKRVKDTLGVDPDHVKREISRVRMLWHSPVDKLEEMFTATLSKKDGAAEEPGEGAVPALGTAESLRTLFSQEPGYVVDDLYADEINRLLSSAKTSSELENGVTQLDAKLIQEDDFETPIQSAMRVLLGIRPEAPTHVVLSSEGSVPLPPSVACLSGMIALSMLLLPGSQILLKTDPETRMKAFRSAVQNAMSE